MAARLAGTELPGVALRPVTPADEPQIESWIRQPEIQRWWGNAATAAAEVRLATQSPSAICRIIVADGRAVGYAHALDAGLWGASLPEGLPPGSFDLDLFVADASMRGRGVGQAAVKLLVAEVFQTTLAVAVSVFVSVRNEAAVRAYEKAGFRWRRIWEDPVFGPMWLMLRERS